MDKHSREPRSLFPTVRWRLVSVDLQASTVLRRCDPERAVENRFRKARFLENWEFGLDRHVKPPPLYSYLSWCPAPTLSKVLPILDASSRSSPFRIRNKSPRLDI